MFFSHKEKICLGDKEYHDFWIFLRKYQNIEVIDKLDSRKREIIKEIEKIVNPNWMDIEYLISLKSVNDQDSDSRHGLTKERIIEFREILFLYLHFLKKKRLKALDKLKEEKNNLPIAKFRDTILDLVKNNSVILIAGDTGCGKSTQVPQYLLEAGYTGIACTQPRRIACVSLSKRVSYESQSTSEVGYQIRFDKHKSKDTKLLFLTEGLMLRQITSDPLLSMYNVIILDEVHERHLSCDFLLGLMKCLLIKRDNLKLILMSATINTKLFSWYFGDCPTVEVPGRLYPIELYYYPIRELPKGSKIDSAPYLKMLKMIDDKYPSTQRGDVLIFLSGLNEILNLADALKSYASESKRWVILMLHSSLSLESQDMVFDIPPEGVRKCILSTNIAETSITIDGIRFVIDSGKVKEMNFDKNSRMQRLQEFWISKASAEQRKGRAGRTGPGICYRFYSLKEFDSMEVYSTPEIQRIPLDFLILGMISLGLPDARKFPFLEPPPIECIEESLKLLKNYGALTSDESITSMGKMLSRLPVDLSIGKMLILGSIFQVSGIILTLSAALSVQSPFSLAYRHIDSIEARKEVESNEGDPFVLINAYNRWLDIKFEQKEDSRKWCKKRGFEQERFYEMTKLRRQFKEILKDSGLYWSNEYCASTSSERIRRHGEVSQLRTLKRKIESVGPKKKILKLGLDGEVEDKEDNDYDLKEIEFRLEYNSKQIKKLRQESDSLSRKEILLIKLILSSGLYPQFALPDEFNSVKKDSDQMYHTKKKQFVVLHPNSIYSLNPEILNTSSKNVNAMLTYVSLLETNRPYLCNCLHIPPLHNSLLLCQSIDTNKDFTRIICDQWIEYTFPLNIWQLIIKKVIKIRFLWEQLIEQVFKEYFIEDVVKNNKEMVSIISQDLIDSQRHLVKLINNFFKIDVTYKMRRLMSADIKVLYKKSSSSSSSSSSLSSSSFLIKENLDLKSLDIDECLCYDNNKGGWRLTNYLIYDCLTESDYDKSSYLRKHWTCDICSIVMMCTPSEQYEHRQSCLQVINKDNKKKDKYNSNNNIDRDNSNNDIADYKDDDDDDDEKANEISSNRILRKIYDCNICGKQLDLTTIEILKHIREHN